MPGPNIKTVRTSSHPLGAGDFTSIQAWEDYADGQANAYQWAECYPSGDLGNFTVSGWSSTPTESEYPRIFAASGYEHGGVLSRGPTISDTYDIDPNTISVNYTQIDGLKSHRGFVLDLDSASNMVIENCAVISYNHSSFSVKSAGSNVSSSGNIIKNCVSVGNIDYTTNDIGFELGGENMIHGKPEIKCYNCTTYGQSTVGYKVFNSKIPGGTGGGNVDVRNCIGMNNDGGDFIFVGGGEGSLTFTHNLSQDSTASVGTDCLSSQNAGSVFETPSKYLAASGLDESVINLRLPSDSPAVNAGAILTEVTRDIASTPRTIVDTFDIGAYEYFIYPNSSASLFIQGPVYWYTPTTLMIANGFKNYNTTTFSIEGYRTASSTGTLFTMGPLQTTSAPTLFLRNFKTPKHILLFVEGKSVVPSTNNLQKGILVSFDSLGAVDLFMYGVPHQTNTSTLNIAGNNPFTAYRALNVLNPTASTEVVMVNEISRFSYNYIPKSGSTFLYAKGESDAISKLGKCDVEVAYYAFENNANDGCETFDLTEHSAEYASGLYRMVGDYVAKFDGSGHFSHAHAKEFSSDDDGICVSFMIRNTLPATGGIGSPPKYGPGGYDEGVITKGVINFPKWGLLDENKLPGSFSGDWGIFKSLNETDNSTYDLVFYVNPTDDDNNLTEVETTIRGLSNYSVYFIMFWIDANNKKSYVRYVEVTKYVNKYVQRPITQIAQSWSGNVNNEEGKDHELLIGQNSGIELGAPLIGVSQNLGGNYSQNFTMDEVRISKNINSVVAMKSSFDANIQSYFDSYTVNTISKAGGRGEERTDFPTLYIRGFINEISELNRDSFY